jgi:hypothetical protein
MPTLLFLAASVLAADSVVGGSPVDPGRWDDTVALLDGGVSVCSGTLIASEWVLTAGHCVAESDLAEAVIGTKDWFDPLQGETLRIKEAITYPAWSATFDLGLVRLEGPSSYPPARLAADCVAEQDLVDGARAWIVGFGTTDEEGVVFQPLLNEAATTIADADCSEPIIDGLLSGCRTGDVNPGGELGAGGGGIDSCFGDSGGPLYLESPRGLFVAGITSRSYAGVDGAFPCRSGGIWVRPDAALAWIEENTGPLSRPACNVAPIAGADPVVVRGRHGSTRVTIADPDSVAFRYEVIGVTHGEVEIGDDGLLAYRAGPTFAGTDEVRVRVTDDGSIRWPASGEAVAEIAVPVRGTPGCETGPGAGFVAGLVMPLVRRRRAR